MSRMPSVVAALGCLLTAGAAVAQPPLAPKPADDAEYPIVLGLHQVVPDSMSVEPNMPVAHVSVIESALRWLRDNGIRTLTMDEYCEAVRRPDPPHDTILLTVDDGYETVYTQLYPLMRKYGMHLVSFVITDHVGKRNTENPHQPWLDWEQCRELQQSGYVDIEAHAARGHQKIKGRVAGHVTAGPWLLTRLYDPATRVIETQAAFEKRVRQEFMEARDTIEREVGRRPRAFCWPFGATNDFALQACRAGGFEVSFTLDKKSSDPGCRRRYHLPDQQEAAFKLLERHPEHAAAAVAVESAEVNLSGTASAAVPNLDTVAAQTLPARRAVAPIAISCAAATLIWGALYILLFRHD